MQINKYIATKYFNAFIIFIWKVFCFLNVFFGTVLDHILCKLKQNQLRTIASLSTIYEGMYTNHSSDGLEQLEILHRQLYALQVHAQVHSTIWCLTAHQKPFGYCNNNTLCPLDIIPFRMSLCFFSFPFSFSFFLSLFCICFSFCLFYCDRYSLFSLFYWILYLSSLREALNPSTLRLTHTHIVFSEQALPHTFTKCCTLFGRTFFLHCGTQHPVSFALTLCLDVLWQRFNP